MQKHAPHDGQQRKNNARNNRHVITHRQNNGKNNAQRGDDKQPRQTDPRKKSPADNTFPLALRDKKSKKRLIHSEVLGRDIFFI